MKICFRDVMKFIYSIEENLYGNLFKQNTNNKLTEWKEKKEKWKQKNYIKIREWSYEKLDIVK